MRHLARHLIILFAVTVPAFAQTSNELWNSLMEGNRAFVAGNVSFENLDELRNATAMKQNPPVTVLSCSDSRVPPELLFHKPIDQLFIIRVAGNVASPFEIASIEYAVAQGWTKLIVVLGHEECGAVKAALSGKDAGSPSLNALVERIRESFKAKKPNLRAAVEANARATAAYLQAHSKIIHDAVHSGKVGMIVGYYNLSSGAVERIQ